MRFNTNKDFLRVVFSEIFVKLTRGSDSQVYCKKAVLKSFKHFIEKNLYMSLFWNKVADLQPQTSFKNRLLYRCFPIKFAKYSRAPFLQNTSGWLLPFVCHVNHSHQILPLNLFFAFYFNYRQSKHFSFLNVLGNLAMNELIYCW